MVYEIETENTYDDFSKNKEMFDFSNNSAKSNYYDDSSALVVGKMNDEMGDIAIEEFVGLNPKMYSILGRDSSKKAKGVNKNVVAKINYNEYKVILLNKTCFRHSMNRIQSKNHRIELMESTKLICFIFLILELMPWLLPIRADYNFLNPRQKLFQKVIRSAFLPSNKNIILIFDLTRTALLSSYKIVNFQSNQNSLF